MSASSSAATPSPSTRKKPAPDGKIYYSYADVHYTVTSLYPLLQEFNPSVLIAIGGGGYIPARILRTQIKKPILAVSLELYDDTTNTISETGVKCLQWFDEHAWPGTLVEGGNVLIIDEVDDTRTTLQYCVEEMLRRNKPNKIGVAVVHNKVKPKRGILPEGVEYFAGANVPDRWNCYPWDAAAYGKDIEEHEELARICSEAE